MYPLRAIKNITAYLGCDKAEDAFACLQNYENVTELIEAFDPDFGIISDDVFGHVTIDYDYVPTVPSEMFVNNNFTEVPIIIGANSDEGTAFVSSTVDNENIKEYLAAKYTHLSESQLDTILDLYKDNNPEFQPPYQPPFPVSFEGYRLGFRRAASIVGDLRYIGPKRHAAKNWVSKNLTAYTYRWNLFLNDTAEQVLVQLMPKNYVGILTMIKHPSCLFLLNNKIKLWSLYSIEMVFIEIIKVKL